MSPSLQTKKRLKDVYMTSYCRPFLDVSRPNIDVFIDVDLSGVFNVDKTSWVRRLSMKKLFQTFSRFVCRRLLDLHVDVI